ncbi:MAG: c-type cytochrome biogenesis protein CcmI [Nevskiales bacterium]
MTIFLLAAVAITLAATLMLMWPWLLGRQAMSDTGRQRRALNRKIYKDRLAQIEEDTQAGRLSSAQAQSLRDEAGQHLVQDIEQLSGTDSTTGDGQTGHKRPLGIMLLVLVLMPAIGITVYLQSDSWMLIGESAEKPAWQYITKQLRQRVAAKPDADGLLMLARSLRAQGDTAGAIEAYAQLNQLSGYKVANYLADEAEARILAQQGAFTALAVQRLQQALEANPNDGRALWYLGLAALTQGDQSTAKKHWLKLSEQTLPDNIRKVLDQQLIQLGVTAGVAGRKAESQNEARLQLQISADPALTAGLKPDTPVFVMARPADGSRAMLAVRKHRLSELPLNTVLTDGMNMAGGPQLSDYEDYRVVVRIAVSGDALPQKGDPYAEVKVSSANAASPVELNIQQRLP